MDAIVTAGGTLNPDSPLFELTGVEKKALIPLAGKPMISYVLEALFDSGRVANIVIVGLEPEDLPDQNGRQLYFVPSRNSLLDNIFAGLEKLQEFDPALKKFLLFSSDIPLITAATVRGFIDECGDQSADFYYSAIEERTMEARFPGSKRSYVPFKGGRYCGGDAFLIDVKASHGNIELARQLTSVRKNYFKQVQLTGFDFIIRFLFRQMSIHEAAKRVAGRVWFQPAAVDTKFAELGMDLDKPRQYEIIKAELEKQAGSKASYPAGPSS
jgi:CTP:molybdopterin cytidylyltransferase MocA